MLSGYFSLLVYKLNFLGIFPMLTGGVSEIPSEEEILGNEIKTVSEEAEVIYNQDPKQSRGQFLDLKKKLLSKVQKMQETANSAKFIRARDKLVFVSGVFRTCLGIFILGRFPCYFPAFHSLATVFYIFARWVHYRGMNMHYYLFDFCYYANTLIVIHLMVFPDSKALYCITFAFSHGHLLISVAIFHTSLVFHSLEKTITNYTHLVPAIVCWGLNISDCGSPSFDPKEIGLLEYYQYVSMGYFVWFAGYYLIIFVITYETWNKKGYPNLYSYAMSNEKFRTYKFCNIFGPKLRPLMFLVQHSGVGMVVFIFGFFSIHSVYFQTLLVMGITLLSVWNGANYYLEIFSRNYELKLKELSELKSKLTNDN